MTAIFCENALMFRIGQRTCIICEAPITADLRLEIDSNTATARVLADGETIFEGQLPRARTEFEVRKTFCEEHRR